MVIIENKTNNTILNNISMDQYAESVKRSSKRTSDRLLKLYISFHISEDILFL